MILEAVIAETGNEESDIGDSEDIEVESNIISQSEGCKATKQAIKYVEQQPGTTVPDLLLTATSA